MAAHDTYRERLESRFSWSRRSNTTMVSATIYDDRFAMVSSALDFDDQVPKLPSPVYSTDDHSDLLTPLARLPFISDLGIGPTKPLFWDRPEQRDRRESALSAFSSYSDASDKTAVSLEASFPDKVLPNRRDSLRGSFMSGLSSLSSIPEWSVLTPSDGGSPRSSYYLGTPRDSYFGALPSTPRDSYFDPHPTRPKGWVVSTPPPPVATPPEASWFATTAEAAWFSPTVAPKPTLRRVDSYASLGYAEFTVRTLDDDFDLHRDSGLLFASEEEFAERMSNSHEELGDTSDGHDSHDALDDPHDALGDLHEDGNGLSRRSDISESARVSPHPAIQHVGRGTVASSLTAVSDAVGDDEKAGSMKTGSPSGTSNRSDLSSSDLSGTTLVAPSVSSSTTVPGLSDTPPQEFQLAKWGEYRIPRTWQWRRKNKVKALREFCYDLHDCTETHALHWVDCNQRTVFRKHRCRCHCQEHVVAVLSTVGWEMDTARVELEHLHHTECRSVEGPYRQQTRERQYNTSCVRCLHDQHAEHVVYNVLLEPECPVCQTLDADMQQLQMYRQLQIHHEGHVKGVEYPSYGQYNEVPLEIPMKYKADCHICQQYDKPTRESLREEDAVLYAHKLARDEQERQLRLDEEEEWRWVNLKALSTLRLQIFRDDRRRGHREAAVYGG